MAKSTEQLKEKVIASTEMAVAESKPKTVAQQLHEELEKMKPQIAMAVPKHITPDRMLRVALTVIRMNPKIMECSKTSIISCVLEASQLGLEFGSHGHAYMVPYNNKKKMPDGTTKWVKEAQFIAGYKGLLSLARRSGEIQTIAADAIYSNDKFRYRKGFDEVLEHEPNFQDRGQLIAFYAYGTTKDGGRYATVMTLQDVEKIKQRSKSKDYGPWVTDFEEMGKKTVLRRLCKYLPMSIEFADADRKDQDIEFGSMQPGDEIQLNLGSEEKTQAALEVGTTHEVSFTPVSDAELAADEASLAQGDMMFELQE